MRVIVEGTITPAVGGPERGERWEVDDSDTVRGWVRAGAAVIISFVRGIEVAKHLSVDAEADADADDDGDDDGDADISPARNASRDQWAAYLRGKGIRFPDDREAFDAGEKTAWAGRDDLVIIAQQAFGGR